MKYQISLLFKQQHLVAIRRNYNVVFFLDFTVFVCVFSCCDYSLQLPQKVTNISPKPDRWASHRIKSNCTPFDFEQISNTKRA